MALTGDRSCWCCWRDRAIGPTGAPGPTGRPAVRVDRYMVFTGDRPPGAIGARVQRRRGVNGTDGATGPRSTGHSVQLERRELRARRSTGVTVTRDRRRNRRDGYTVSQGSTGSRGQSPFGAIGPTGRRVRPSHRRHGRPRSDGLQGATVATGATGDTGAQGDRLKGELAPWSDGGNWSTDRRVRPAQRGPLATRPDGSQVFRV